MMGKLPASLPIGMILALVLVAPGCRKAVPPRPPVEGAPLPALEVKKAGVWLYTYVDAEGTFTTTDKLDDIPEASRRLVRVVDPAQAAGDRRDTNDVYVVDASELAKADKVTARVMSRQAFETSALL